VTEAPGLAICADWGLLKYWDLKRLQDMLLICYHNKRIEMIFGALKFIIYPKKILKCLTAPKPPILLMLI
jgi:hypothetical protein